jgi:hypothetical protein
MGRIETKFETERYEITASITIRSKRPPEDPSHFFIPLSKSVMSTAINLEDLENLS